MKTAKRAWAFMFDVVGDAKTVDGWRAAAVHILALCLMAAAFYPAAKVCLLVMPFIEESVIAISLYRTAGIILLTCAILAPTIYAAIFRLRAGRGLGGALAATAIYSPIFGLALSVSFAASALLFGEAHSAFSMSWIAGSIPFALILGPAASALTALAYRMGKAPAPPPAITARRFYAPIEITISIAALGCILSVPILSD